MDLSGAIDLHVHSAPDIHERSVDDLDLVREAAAEGMRAVLMKSHHTLTADRAAVAGKDSPVAAFGGLALNLDVGGLNSVAVETAIAFGAKQIWMPTAHARNCLETAEQPVFRAEAAKGRTGITVLDADGGLVQEMGPILEMIRDADIILGTGHLAPEESLTLLKHAHDMGLRKLLVTHPLMSFTWFEHDQLEAAVALGAMLELDYLCCTPKWPGAIPPSANADAIRVAGHRHCVLATDGGQAYNPHPAIMLREFALALRAEGIPEAELRAMLCDNPAQLLGI